ncbi:hypothetical protein AURANDRAFT_72707, partial [Aureococcus anophagefferens]
GSPRPPAAAPLRRRGGLAEVGLRVERDAGVARPLAAAPGPRRAAGPHHGALQHDDPHVRRAVQRGAAEPRAQDLRDRDGQRHHRLRQLRQEPHRRRHVPVDEFVRGRRQRVGVLRLRQPDRRGPLLQRRLGLRAQLHALRRPALRRAHVDGAQLRRASRRLQVHLGPRDLHAPERALAPRRRHVFRFDHAHLRRLQPALRGLLRRPVELRRPRRVVDGDLRGGPLQPGRVAGQALEVLHRGRRDDVLHLRRLPALARLLVGQLGGQPVGLVRAAAPGRLPERPLGLREAAAGAGGAHADVVGGARHLDEPHGEAHAHDGAGQESEIPNFKGSFLGRFPLVHDDPGRHVGRARRAVVRRVLAPGPRGPRRRAGPGAQRHVDLRGLHDLLPLPVHGRPGLGPRRRREADGPGLHSVSGLPLLPRRSVVLQFDGRLLDVDRARVVLEPGPAVRHDLGARRADFDHVRRLQRVPPLRRHVVLQHDGVVHALAPEEGRRLPALAGELHVGPRDRRGQLGRVLPPRVEAARAGPLPVAVPGRLPLQRLVRAGPEQQRAQLRDLQRRAVLRHRARPGADGARGREPAHRARGGDGAAPVGAGRPVVERLLGRAPRAPRRHRRLLCGGRDRRRRERVVHDVQRHLLPALHVRQGRGDARRHHGLARRHDGRRRGPRDGADPRAAAAAARAGLGRVPRPVLRRRPVEPVHGREQFVRLPPRRDAPPGHRPPVPPPEPAVGPRGDQGSKRERHSQLQRLLSRPFSTRGDPRAHARADADGEPLPRRALYFWRRGLRARVLPDDEHDLPDGRARRHVAPGHPRLPLQLLEPGRLRLRLLPLLPGLLRRRLLQHLLPRRLLLHRRGHEHPGLPALLPGGLQPHGRRLVRDRRAARALLLREPAARRVLRRVQRHLRRLRHLPVRAALHPRRLQRQGLQAQLLRARPLLRRVPREPLHLQPGLLRRVLPVQGLPEQLLLPERPLRPRDGRVRVRDDVRALLEHARVPPVGGRGLLLPVGLLRRHESDARGLGPRAPLVPPPARHHDDPGLVEQVLDGPVHLADVELHVVVPGLVEPDEVGHGHVLVGLGPHARRRAGGGGEHGREAVGAVGRAHPAPRHGPVVALARERELDVEARGQVVDGHVAAADGEVDEILAAGHVAARRLDDPGAPRGPALLDHLRVVEDQHAVVRAVAEGEARRRRLLQRGARPVVVEGRVAHEKLVAVALAVRAERVVERPLGRVGVPALLGVDADHADARDLGELLQ